MLADGAVAWLDVPLSRVIERIPRDGRRPLAADLGADGAALPATPASPTPTRTCGSTPRGRLTKSSSGCWSGSDTRPVNDT